MMSLSESERLRTRLDALTWRLKEAVDDLERIRLEASSVQRHLQDAQVAHLLGEDGPGDITSLTARSEKAQFNLEEEESLVQRLEQLQAETQERYRQARLREWRNRWR